MFYANLVNSALTLALHAYPAVSHNDTLTMQHMGEQWYGWEVG